MLRYCNLLKFIETYIHRYSLIRSYHLPAYIAATIGPKHDESAIHSYGCNLYTWTFVLPAFCHPVKNLQHFSYPTDVCLFKVFGANSVELVTKQRTEHLTESDKMKTRTPKSPLQSFLGIAEVEEKSNNVADVDQVKYNHKLYQQKLRQPHSCGGQTNKQPLLFYTGWVTQLLFLCLRKGFTRAYDVAPERPSRFSFHQLTEQCSHRYPGHFF